MLAAVLGLSLESNVLPTIAYLASVGVDAPKAVRKHPQLLGLSIAANLQPTVAFLEA